MERTTRTIALLLAVLALVAAAVALAALWPRITGRPAATGDIQGLDAPSPFAPLSRLDPDAITEIVLTAAGRTIRLENRQGTWKMPSSIVFDVDATAIQGLLNVFASLYSERTVEEHPGDLAPYGLDPPRAIARATLRDGTVHEVRIGKVTAAGDSSYAMAARDPRVYTVYRELADRFLATPDDLWTPSRPQVRVERITSLRIERGARTVVELAYDPKLSSGDEPEFLVTSTFVVKPWKRPKPVDWRAVQRLLERFSQMPREHLVDSTPVDLASYGLTQPSWRLVVRDDRATLDLRFGRIEGEGVYFQHAGEPPVYLGDRSLVDALDVDPFSFVNKFAAIVELDRIDGIELRGMGRDHTITIRREGTGEVPRTTFEVDGRAVAEQSFREFYQKLILLQTDAVHDEALAEQPDFTISYHFTSGSVRTYRVSFVPYNADFYAVFKNGRTDLLVNRMQVKNLLADIDAYVESLPAD